MPISDLGLVHEPTQARPMDDSGAGPAAWIATIAGHRRRGARA